MTKDQVVEIVIKLTANQLSMDPAKLSLKDPVLGIGADSLMMIGLIREFEKTFNVRIKLRELFEEINTFEDLANLIVSRIAPTDQAKKPEVTPPTPTPSPVTKPEITPPTAPPSSLPATDAASGNANQYENLAQQLKDIEKMSSELKRQMEKLQSGEPQKSEKTAAGTDSLASAESFTRQVMQRYAEKTKKSKEIAQRYRVPLSDSRGTVGFRKETKEVVYPIAAVKGKGAYIEDVDGNRLLDLTMGFGILLFGHEPDFIQETLARRLEQGILLGPRHEDTGKTAELLCKITGFDRAAFATNGTEANSGAVRLARGFTNKDKIVMFKGSYHGHLDLFWGQTLTDSSELKTIPSVRGIPQNAVNDLIVLEYGDDKSLEIIKNMADQIAVVIVEPVQSRYPHKQPKEFVQALRKITSEKNILLMFDEMLTGFRPHLKGMAGMWGIQPDLATYGKLLGGGLPIGAIAGRADIMALIDGGIWQFGDASGPEEETTFFGGTYMQHPLVMSVAYAVLSYLEKHSPELQNNLNQKVARIAKEINDFCDAQGYPLHINHFGSLFLFEGPAATEILYDLLALEGIYIWEWRKCFLSTAHSDADVEFIIAAVKRSLEAMGSHGVIKKKINLAQEKISLTPEIPTQKAPKFSVYFFGTYPESSNAKEHYEFVIQAVKFADANQFHAAWIPERHFHAFGGIFPNPSILASALSRETKQIRLSSGSVVLPLHNPIRVVEEWSVIDNLSSGRVQLGFASGWHPNDFVFYPDYFGKHKEIMFQHIDTFKRLWRGESIHVAAGNQSEIDIKTFPRPFQKDPPPLFIAIVGNKESYMMAGQHGLGVITNLMTQSIEDLKQSIELYRKTLAESGSNFKGWVVVLLHTHLATDSKIAKEEAFKPLCEYLKSSLHLLDNTLNSLGFKIDLKNTSPEDVDFMLEKAYQHYLHDRSLIGTVDEAKKVIDQLTAIGVDEIGCFIDFGLPSDKVMRSLTLVNELKGRYTEKKLDSASAEIVNESGPLTPGQEGLWFLENLLPDKHNMHTEVKAIHLRGKLDVEKLKYALSTVIKRHSILSAIIKVDAEGPKLIAQKDGLTWEIINYEGQNPDEVMKDVINREGKRNFNLATGPLFYVHLLKFGPEHHVIVFTVHHIIFDALSSMIIAQEASAIYANQTLPPLSQSYIQHAYQAKKKWDNTDLMKEEVAFWLETLKGDLPELTLPYDYTPTDTFTGRGTAFTKKLSFELSEQLRAYSQQQRMTLFTILLAGFVLCLKQWSGQNDIILGTPIADRSDETENLIGYFLNTVILRFQIDEKQSFNQWLKEVRAVLLDAQEHGTLPFEYLVKKLNPKRQGSRNPLFQIMVEYENQPPFKFSLPGIEAQDIELPVNKSNFDITVFLTNRPEGIQYSVEYSTDLFKEGTIKQIMQSFEELLQRALQHNENKISDIVIPQTTVDSELSAEEYDLIIRKWNETDATYPQDKTIIQLFEQQVERFRDSTALSFQNEKLTYHELNQKANQVAHYIQAITGGKPDTLVALCFDRSLEMIIAMLGILKARAAYVPIDPHYPIERIQYILKDSQVMLVLTQKNFIHKLESAPCHILDESLYGQQDTNNLNLAYDPKDLAYVIYTSGTTGNPKGVLVAHAGVVNTLMSVIHGYQLIPESRVLQFASCSFDASVLEIFGSLLVGATLIIVRKDQLLPGETLAKTLKKEHITHALVTPAVLDVTLDLDYKNLKVIAAAGDICFLNTLQRFGKYRCINVYGVTEVSINSTEWTYQAGAKYNLAPIGKPISNTKLYVLNDNLKPVRIGVIGELYIGGVGVARGYLNREELTKERFIPNPFATESDKAKGYTRLYKTGDLVRWLPDGNLEFLGRNDFQVKIRGFRIELGEIENSLLTYPGIERCIVLAKEREGRKKYLVAYYVSKTPVVAEELIQHLTRLLPEYMVPSAFVHLTEMPLTSHGKIDRNALPAEKIDESKYVAPRNETEMKICSIWQNFLGVDKVGIRDDFFRIGGDSISSTQLVSRLRDQGFDYKVKDIFEYRTIEQLVQHAEKQSVPPSDATKPKPTQYDYAYEPVTVVHPDASGIPLIFLPPAVGGSESYFGTLCPLLPNTKIILIDNYFQKKNNEKNFKSFKKLALYYIDLLEHEGILQTLIGKQCYVGGWSMGAVLAYEMMLEFSKRNITVLDNFLVDPVVPSLIDKKIEILLLKDWFKDYVPEKSEHKITLFRCTQYDENIQFAKTVAECPYLGYNKVTKNIEEYLLNAKHLDVFSDASSLNKISAIIESKIESKNKLH